MRWGNLFGRMMWIVVMRARHFVCLMIIIPCISFIFPHIVEAQTMKDVFMQMPSSLMPYLSENNRLDMIDFMDSGMKAEVTNLLNGRSEMTALGDDSLTIRLSEALTVHMLLLKTATPIDSCHQVVCLAWRLGTDFSSLDTKIEFYTPKWKKTDQRPQLTDAEEARLKTLILQTILKWEEEKINKR